MRLFPQIGRRRPRTALRELSRRVLGAGMALTALGFAAREASATCAFAPYQKGAVSVKFSEGSCRYLQNGQELLVTADEGLKSAHANCVRQCEASATKTSAAQGARKTGAKTANRRAAPNPADRSVAKRDATAVKPARPVSMQSSPAKSAAARAPASVASGSHQTAPAPARAAAKSDDSSVRAASAPRERDRPAKAAPTASRNGETAPPPKGTDSPKTNVATTPIAVKPASPNASTETPSERSSPKGVSRDAAGNQVVETPAGGKTYTGIQNPVKSTEQSAFTVTKGSTTYGFATADQARAAARDLKADSITRTDTGKAFKLDASGEIAEPASGLSKDERAKLVADFNSRQKDKSAAAAVSGEGKKDGKNKKDPGPEENCRVSSGIKAEYRCDKTHSIAKAVVTGNEIIQTSGATAINAATGMLTQTAPGAKQSELMKGQANSALVATKYESVLAAANLAASVALNRQARAHRKNAGALEEQRDALSAPPSNDPLTAGSGQPGAGAQMFAAAAAEQRTTQTVAAAAAFKAAMAGVKSLSNVAAASNARKVAQNNAALYAAQEAAAARANIAFDASGPVSTNAATGGPNFNDPNAVPTTTPGDTATDAAPTNLLGDGTDTGPGEDAPTPLTPGTFKAASGTGAPGGGGASMGGSPGNGGPGGGNGNGGNDEPKAAYASEFGTKEKYESGGALPGAKPGAAGKAKEDGGFDFNGLLAQFLPSKDEKDAHSEKSILDFKPGAAGPDRAPAEAASYLDKNADLFQRIHETMSDKHRRGYVGT